MRISTNWIKDYIDLEKYDLKEVANKVTKAGVNVEGYLKTDLNNLVIGKILKVEKHPSSDHLNICKVDIKESVLQIVCGANNVKENIKVIVAKVGAILPGNFEIKKSVIRGVESNGMICALFELGLESKEENYDKGIYIASCDAEIGEDAVKYLGLDDVIYDLDLNPNRNDCLSHLGFAYELSAVLKEKIKLPNTNYKEIDDSIKNHLNLKIDTANCTMYRMKMVRDVVIKESPDFIKKRLISAGMRPINNVVDISNYVMLEYGQPLHFFDKDKVGNNICVRMAKEDEEVITLDNVKRTLKDKDIVITNDKEVVAIAGVMGCLNSEVVDDTKDILIESAIFNPYNVRYTSIDLDLRSEASLRFEKEMNYEYTKEALDRACYLLEKYADGKVLKDEVVYDNVCKTPKQATITRDKINKVLGMNLTHEDIMDSFNSLGFEVKEDNGSYNVIIPNRRMDVSIKEDLIEEVGRLYGYDNIVAKLPEKPLINGGYSPFIRYRKDISKLMRSLGLDEARTHTLISEKESNMFSYDFREHIVIDKPMNVDKKVVRQSLIPSLINIINYNKSRGIDNVKLYEISNTYGGNYEEFTKLGVVLKGNLVFNEWSKKGVKIDFYVVKGIVEELLEFLGLKNRYTFKVSDLPKEIHPGVSAEVIVDNEAVGYFGLLHPSFNKSEIYVIEINLTKLYTKRVGCIKYKEASKYPSVKKDLAFIVKDNVSCKDIKDIIRKSGGRLLTNIDVFDVYTGDNLGKDELSMAFSLTFNDSNKTLSDVEVNEIFYKIIDNVEKKLGAKLRDK